MRFLIKLKGKHASQSELERLVAKYVSLLKPFISIYNMCVLCMRRASVTTHESRFSFIYEYPYTQENRENSCV